MLKGRTWADPEGQKQIYTELLFGREQRPKEEAVNERNKWNGGDQIHSLPEMCTLPICNGFICIQIIKLQNKTILQHGILSSAGWGRFNNKVCKRTHTTQHFTLAGSVLSQLLLSGLQLVFLFWMLSALQDANCLQESLFPVVTLKLHSKSILCCWQTCTCWQLSARYSSPSAHITSYYRSLSIVHSQLFSGKVQSLLFLPGVPLDPYLINLLAIRIGNTATSLLAAQTQTSKET